MVFLFQIKRIVFIYLLFGVIFYTVEFLKFLKSRFFIINLFNSILIFILIVLLFDRYLHFYTNQSEKIKVPSLRSLSLKEVKIVLDDLMLRYEILTEGNYDPSISKGAVLDQDPKKGEIVKKQRKIYLTVNPRKYANAIIPNFFGKTEKEIIRLIKERGFNVGKFEKVDDIAPVVRGLRHKGRKLKEGDKLKKTLVIDIIIGNGQLK